MRRDDQTLELPGVPKKRGRPKTGKALTGAERMRRLRARRAAQANGISVTCDENSNDISVTPTAGAVASTEAESITS